MAETPNKTSANSSSHSFNVERIIRSKKIDNTQFYLVKWEGIPIKDSTWEPKENLKNVKQILRNFERNQRRRKKLQIKSL